MIYIVRNDYAHSGHPNLYKIGLSENTRINNRLKSLNSSSSNIGEFREIGHVVVRDVREVEKEVFALLGKFRVQSNREFFDCDLNIIVDTILMVGGERIVASEMPTELPKIYSNTFDQFARKQKPTNIAKIANLDIMDRWLLDFLKMSDSEFNVDPVSPIYFSSEISKHDIFDNFTRYKERQGDYSIIATSQFWKKMYTFHNIFSQSSYNRQVNGKRFRSLKINSRENSRIAFQACYGLCFVWDGEADSGET